MLNFWGWSLIQGFACRDAGAIPLRRVDVCGKILAKITGDTDITVL